MQEKGKVKGKTRRRTTEMNRKEVPGRWLLRCWRVEVLWHVGYKKAWTREANLGRDGSSDSFWVFAVNASSGRNARILVDSGADEHVCPDFASAAALRQTKGGTHD